MKEYLPNIGSEYNQQYYYVMAEGVLVGVRFENTNLVVKFKSAASQPTPYMWGSLHPVQRQSRNWSRPWRSLSLDTYESFRQFQIKVEELNHDH